MDIARLNQILMVYAWFPLASVLAILLLIARFYQGQTGEPTRFVLFLLPIICFGLATIHNARINQSIGSAPGEALVMAGGLILIGLCWMLYRRMTAGR